MRNSAIGSSWDDFEKKNFTPEEITASDARIKRAGKRIKGRIYRCNNKETGYIILLDEQGSVTKEQLETFFKEDK